jgi:hypothetical protein
MLAKTAQFFQVLLVLAIAGTCLASCSASQPQGYGLAVEKMDRQEMLSTNYLPLNADKPGTPVDPVLYTVPGKFTLVEYFSPYDQDCVNLDPLLVQLAQTRTDLAIRTINVNRPDVQGIDVDSPIMQYMQIQKLPYFQIYDTTQALRAQARPAYEQVMQWVQPTSNAPVR